MSDEVLNIKVTEPELDLITLLLEQAGNMEDSNGQPAFELLHDLMEQAARPGEWSDPEDPDLFMDPVDFAVKHDLEPAPIVICDAEINAETATSRAADRRNFNMKVRTRDRKLSKTQTHDVWDANDPRNW